MREDTNFKGSDSSCPSIYFLFYGKTLKPHTREQAAKKTKMTKCNRELRSKYLHRREDRSKLIHIRDVHIIFSHSPIGGLQAIS